MWSNEVAADLLTRSQWDFTRREGSFFTVANQMYYSLPTEVDALVNMRIPEYTREMSFISSPVFQAGVQDETSTGVPDTCITHGIEGVFQQPESVLTLTSSDDTDTMAVAVRGVSGGRERTDSVTLTGTTGADSSVKFNHIISFVAASAVTGTVTITDDAGNTVATIAAGGTTATIASQPAGKASAVSSNAADAPLSSSDATKNVFYRGYDGNGIYIEELVSLNGTTAVLSSNKFNRFENIAKSGTTTGTVTVSTNSGDKIAAKIAPTDRVAEYVHIGLYPVPDAIYNVRYRYRVGYRKMENDYDTFAPIPNKYFHILQNGVLAIAWDYLKYPDRAEQARKEYERGITGMYRDDKQRFRSDLKITQGSTRPDWRVRPSRWVT